MSPDEKVLNLQAEVHCKKTGKRRNQYSHLLRRNIFCRDPTLPLCITNRGNPGKVAHWQKSNKVYIKFLWRAQTRENMMKSITTWSGILTHQSNNELLHSLLYLLVYSVKSWISLVKNALSVKWWPNRNVLNYKDWTSWEKSILHLLPSDRWEKEWMKYLKINFFSPNGIFYYQSLSSGLTV